MPQSTALYVGILALTAIIGGVAGWMLRGRRGLLEKIALNAGWHERFDAQRQEQDRLLEQNERLMHDINEMKAAGKSAADRNAELSASLDDALRQRDELLSEVSEIRDHLESRLTYLSANDDTLNTALIDKDNKIFKLSRELNSWQQRLPPLIDRFRRRNAEAERLEAALAEAEARILALESATGTTSGPPVATPKHPVSEDASGGETSNDTGEARADDECAGEAYRHDAAFDGACDDLQLISGIGPSIEKTLNELGIFTLSQIAEMSEYDIDRVASRLKGFRSRFYREDWIGQARELQYQPRGHRIQ